MLHDKGIAMVKD